MIIIIYPELYGVHGIARYVQSYLQNVDLQSNDIALITIPAPEGSTRPRGVTLVELPMGRGRLGLLFWSLRARREARRLMRDGEGQATLNFHIPPLLPAIVGRPTGARASVVAHTTYLGLSGQYDSYRHFRGHWSASSVWIKQLLERIIFAQSQRIVTLTKQGQLELARYGRRSNVEIVPNGVDRSLFAFDGSAGPPEPKEYDVAFVGRIEKRKGSRSLVEVCRALASRKPDIRIAVAGYGDDFEHVRLNLDSLSNVKFLGKQTFKEVVLTYAKSSLYASTSYYEGLPGTCLEAMAMGLPAVVWDLPFYHELVLDGVTGVRVPVDDVRSFAARAIELLNDQVRAADMGRRSRDLIEGAYDWHVLAPAVTKAIDVRNGDG